jgi:hypothetical protein
MHAPINASSLWAGMATAMTGFMMPNVRDQRLATKGLSIPTDFIASPLHRLVLGRPSSGRLRSERNPLCVWIRFPDVGFRVSAIGGFFGEHLFFNIPEHTGSRRNSCHKIKDHSIAIV